MADDLLTESDHPSPVFVVGAGWGAAKALCEAGARGFWKDYPNINALTAELGLSDVFTEFNPSALCSPAGLEATALVFGEGTQWFSPLGQALATVHNFKRLPVADRLSVSGLLVAMWISTAVMRSSSNTTQSMH